MFSQQVFLYKMKHWEQLSYRNWANTCKHWTNEIWVQLSDFSPCILISGSSQSSPSKVWNTLERPLHSHIYLHTVQYQRPLTGSESLNGVEKCVAWTSSYRRLHENGTWHNLPNWATRVSITLSTRNTCPFGNTFRQDRNLSTRNKNREFLQCHLNSTVWKWTNPPLFFVQTFITVCTLNPCRKGYCCLFSVQKRIYERCPPRRRYEHVCTLLAWDYDHVY